MSWGAVACSKPASHCGPTVDPSVCLWRCVGLHRGPRKPGSKARAAVFVGCASATLTLILGCRGVSQACHTIGHTEKNSMRLLRDAGLHRNPWNSGSKYRAAVSVGCASAPFGPLLGLWPMLWGTEGCPKLATRCEHTVDPSMHL